MTVIEQNLAAARSLLKAAKMAGIKEDVQDSRVILKDVPVDLIRTFIRGYGFHEDSEVTSELLVRYVDGQRKVGALETWNIAVIGRKPPSRTLALGLVGDSPLITRSKLWRSSNTSRAVIGTLMSKPDRVADLVPAATVRLRTTDEELQRQRDDDGRGLLVLYPIDKDSKPKESSTDRIALDAAGDLLGVALCFPTAGSGTEPVSTIQVDLSDVTALDVEDAEDYVDLEGSHDEVDLVDG
jgi:hypothetical protein